MVQFLNLDRSLLCGKKDPKRKVREGLAEGAKKGTARTQTAPLPPEPCLSLHAGAQIDQDVIGPIDSNPADTGVLEIEDDVHGKRKDR